MNSCSTGLDLMDATSCDEKLGLRMNAHVRAVRYACGMQDSSTGLI